MMKCKTKDVCKGRKNMSNRYTFDQGTIVYGIKSLKYPDSVCYGIIITASCDIA